MLDDFARVLRFKPHLLVLDAGPDALYVVDEFRRSVLPGEAFPALAGCMRDGLTIAQIFEALTARFSEWQILTALDHLVQRAYVCADSPGEGDVARGFFERVGLDGEEASRVAAQLQVAVEAFGVDPQCQIDALSACGVQIVPQAAITVALCASYDHPGLGAAAERAAARDSALLIVTPTGAEPRIGPLLTPGGAAADVPCMECLRYWTALNRPVQTLLARHHGLEATRLPSAHSRASMGAVAALVAAFVEQLAVSARHRQHAGKHILSLRVDTFATAWHRVVRRPQCPRCGNPAWMREQAGRPPRLATADVRTRSAGGFRIAQPQQVFEQYRHLISPVSGPVAYLHPMPGRNAGMRNVYVAGYLVCPRAAPYDNRFDRICSGKGSSDAQARASALCETLERFSGVYQGDEATIRGSMAGLAAREPDGGEPVHVNALQQFSERQFEQREAINALTDDVRKQVPQRFTADSVIDWTPAWSIASGARRLVPLNYCYAETPDTGASAFCIHNPNGSAAGSCIEEAVLQGLLELVERDAAAIWWYNQVARPGVDIASFADPYFDALLAEYASLGWQLWALDITHDLQIPAIVALARNADTGRFSIGFGCHLDSRIALQRALTEVNQLLDVTAAAATPWDHTKLASEQFLYPAADLPLTDGSRWPRIGGADLKTDIEHGIGRLSSAGMDTLVVDKTRPDIGLPVVQVIVPGLCHFWPRFGAGRLYSVPVRQGWLARPRDEGELNRALLFL
jgi:bacteriocin biosynthesis cyclodehydratase domain-containing protein